ncbi:hypothetical protein PAG44_04030, partial [Klebsiella pneumoniae]|uniref:hypothetical protein n=1 Tax=Klebsiella pneumoniae TaxID=573 RepID=UPI002845D60B
RRNGLNRLIQGIYGRKNRLKHEEMKWLSQPRRISPLIRTFLKPSPHAPVIIAFIVVRLFTACGKC